jgi:negative regulator of flagellin synthesis FlgM
MDTKSIGGLSTNRPNLDKIRVENPESATTSKDQSKKALSGSNVNVNLSNEAMERAQAHRKAQDIALKTSPIREDRVQELKNRIQSGNYKIEPDKIADGMMREAVRDELAKRPVNIA